MSFFGGNGLRKEMMEMKMMNNEEAMVELHECFNCLRFRSDLSVLNYKKALVLVNQSIKKTDSNEAK